MMLEQHTSAPTAHSVVPHEMIPSGAFASTRGATSGVDASFEAVASLGPPSLAVDASAVASTFTVASTFAVSPPSPAFTPPSPSTAPPLDEGAPNSPLSAAPPHATQSAATQAGAMLLMLFMAKKLPTGAHPPRMKHLARMGSEGKHDEGQNVLRARPLQECDMDIVMVEKVDAAMDALELAAQCAERGEEPKAWLRAAVDDFRAAAQKDPRAVRARLDRVVMGNDPELGLDALLAAGALDALFPDVHAMVGFGDGEWRHKDVWKHTKQVVRQAVPRLEVRWAALFHDIGKVKTRSISPDGKVHFLGHAEVGTRMFDKLDRRMPLFSPEPALKDTVRFLILHHLRANQYEPSWTDSAVRRFARELGAHLDDLLCLARADITTKRPEKKRRGLQQIEDLAERITNLAEEDAVVPPLPTGVGDEIMRAFGLKPSRQIGDIKRALEAAIETGEVASHQPSEAYVEFVRANKARFGIP
jgi:poly(A) polymerase